MADFFEKPEETIGTSDTIKLGDKEYSQDDLSRLVGLGEIAQEAEEKFKTKIDRVWPEYTKATQANSDLKRQIADLEARQTQTTVQPEANTSFELTQEQKDLARRQLSDLGFGEDNYRRIVREELAAKDLLGDINAVIGNAREDGQPETTPQDLLAHMQETGIKNPTKAYKDMFEEQLDALKEKKLESIKPSNMVTTTASTAGGKSPQPVKVTKANIQQLVQEAFDSGN